ncbi:hypothetical protein ABG067_007393 [Albugo candida]
MFVSSSRLRLILIHICMILGCDGEECLIKEPMSCELTQTDYFHCKDGSQEHDLSPTGAFGKNCANFRYEFKGNKVTLSTSTKTAYKNEVRFKNKKNSNFWRISLTKVLIRGETQNEIINVEIPDEQIGIVFENQKKRKMTGVGVPKTRYDDIFCRIGNKDVTLEFFSESDQNSLALTISKSHIYESEADDWRLGNMIFELKRVSFLKISEELFEVAIGDIDEKPSTRNWLKKAKKKISNF